MAMNKRVQCIETGEVASVEEWSQRIVARRVRRKRGPPKRGDYFQARSQLWRASLIDGEVYGLHWRRL